MLFPPVKRTACSLSTIRFARMHLQRILFQNASSFLLFSSLYPPSYDIPGSRDHRTWMADSGFSKNLRADWAPGQQINLSHSAPVVCFFNGNDQNCLTLALSEAAVMFFFFLVSTKKMGKASGSRRSSL